MTRFGESARYDVVVAGGGSAGVAAAVAAARCGARTLLIERHGFLGGAATGSNVSSYCGFFRHGPEPVRVVGGIGAELLDILAARDHDVRPVPTSRMNWIVLLDPERLKLGLDRLVEAAGVDILFHASVVGAERRSALVESVDVFAGGETCRIGATAFVDATGDSVLALRAGLPGRRLRDGAAAMQPASFPVRFNGRHGLVPPTAEVRGRIAARARAADPGLPVRANGGHWWTLPGSADLWWMGIDVAVDPERIGDVGVAERRSRRAAHAFLAALRAEPGYEDAFIAGTGPQIGVREGLHVATETVMTRADAAEGRLRPDGIARAGWPMEVHVAPGQVDYVPLGGPGYFDVAYGALCASGVPNLWLAGRTIGADASAYGSLRVMGTSFATGQAAGVAAALDPLRENKVAAIQARLKEQGALL